MWAQSPTPSANAENPSRIRPSPLQRDVGGSYLINGGVGDGETRGGTQEVGGPSSAYENWQRQMSLPVFFHSFFVNPPLTPGIPTVPRPPPPSRPNASRRWSFFDFPHVCHDDHLPRVQTRAGGGFFRFFRPVCPLFHLPRVQTRVGGGSFSVRHVCHQHHLPRVQMRAGGGFFGRFNPPPTATTSLVSKHELEVDFSDLSTRLPPPPPPSCPNASRGWIFSMFRRVCQPHHLPRIQTQAGGGFFRRFDTSSPATTSLASKRELEVDFSDVSTRLPPPPPPSHPSASRRWIFSTFRRLCHYHRLPCVHIITATVHITAHESMTAKTDRRGRG